MARLESLAKGGYYPTPTSVIDQIKTVLDTETGSYAREKGACRILDPCCGTGLALMLLGEHLGRENHPQVETFGVELNAERAQSARDILDDVLTADVFNCSIANEVFSVLFLNPPYDDEVVGASDKSKRTELAFLQRTTRYLHPGLGVLVYIIPKRILRNGEIASYLSANYVGVECWDFPPEERDAFGQVVIMAQRRQAPRVPDTSIVRYLIKCATEPPSFESIRRPTGLSYRRWRASVLPKGPAMFVNLYLDPQQIADEAAEKGLWANAGLREALWPESDDRKLPLMPLRQGHIAMLTAAGFLDNMLLERDGQRILVKGRTYKEFEVTEETEDKIVQTERMRTTVVTLDLDTGVFSDIKA